MCEEAVYRVGGSDHGNRVGSNQFYAYYNRLASGNELAVCGGGYNLSGSDAGEGGKLGDDRLGKFAWRRQWCEIRIEYFCREFQYGHAGI